jgi:aspartate/tyrosine/aromatic aminotransferase
MRAILPVSTNLTGLKSCAVMPGACKRGGGAILAKSDEIQVQASCFSREIARLRELFFGARSSHVGATPASATSAAFRVLSRNTQVFRFLCTSDEKIARLRELFLIFGAQKRTRTSTPYGTRT